MVEVAAIVLAAGRATRFADDEGQTGGKVFAMFEGRPIIAHAVAAAAASNAAPVIVVTGHGAERVRVALAGADVLFVHNAHFANGMAGSLAAGLVAVPETADAALVLLADMPRVAHVTLDVLIAAYDRERPDAVVPVHEGRRGNPVLISRALFTALLRLTGDEGARRVLADGAHRVLSCPVDDPGVLIDVDTRETLNALARG